MTKDLLFESRKASFLEALTMLSREHGLCIKQDADTGQPFIDEMSYDDWPECVKYRTDKDGILWF